MDTVVVESTVPSECNVESEGWAVIKKGCGEIDVAAYTDLIQSEMLYI